MDVITRELKRLKPEESAADNENILEIDREKQRETLATWIAATELPLTTGQRPAFVLFSTELNPLWKEVTPKMVMIDMINIFHKIKKELIADIPKTSRGVSFSASTWTGAHGHGFTYVCFSAHFIDPKTWELNKRTIAFRPLEFDDDYIYQCVVKLLREFNLTRCCFGITFDNSEFNKTSIPYFTREFKPKCYEGELFHLRCATDVINEIVKMGLEEFAPYVTKVRDANVFIASSAKFKEYCEMCRARNLTPKRIVPDWPARWDTTYLMLQNCIGYEEVITSFYESGMEVAKETLGEDETMDMSETLEPHVWEAARSFCSFLEAFENAVRTLSSVYDPTTCLALECVYEMSLALRNARGNEVFKNVIARMDAEFKKYWFKIPMLYALGAIMDPRIRLDGVEAALKAIKTNMGWTEVGVKKDEIEKVLVDLYNSYDAKQQSGDTELEGSFEAPPGSFWAVISGQALYLRNPTKRLVSAPDVRSKSAGKAHYPESKSKPKLVTEESSQKDKKSSIWNWKPLKALSHIRNRRFNCCFSLQVHSIEGLSPDFSNVSVRVHWKRRDGMLQTRPLKVFQGMADFEETLSYRCSVYGSRSGPHHSAKYEAKHCLLYVSVVTAPELDLGKHRVDLTRLLPLTLEELLEEKRSGKWTTAFKLSGKAKGSTLNVSFGYLVIDTDGAESQSNRSGSESMNSKLQRLSTAKSVTCFDKGNNRGPLRRAESISGYPNQRNCPTSQSVDVKILHEVLPTAKSELSSSMSLLYKKLDEDEGDPYAYSKPEFEVFCDDVGSLNPKPEAAVFSEDVESLKPKHKDEAQPEHVKFLNPKLESKVPTGHVETHAPKCDPEKLSEHDEPLEPEAISWFESEKDTADNDGEETDFSVIEQGIEMSSKDAVKFEERTENFDEDNVVSTELEKINKFNMVPLKSDNNPDTIDECYANYEDSFDDNSKDNELFTDESAIEELDSAFQKLLCTDSEGFESPQAKNKFTGPENYMEAKSNYKTKVGKSRSLDTAEIVASDFLDKLGIEHSPFGFSSDSDPESPRERLLRQFEKEALSSGTRLFDFDIENEVAEYSYNAPGESSWGDHSGDLELLSFVEAAEAEHLREAELIKSKTKAKMLEDLETETLMREWGLNEKAFQSSPPNSTGGFGSPIHFSPEEPLELPPLSDGLGPFVQTKDGGFLRSMSPSLFKNGKHSESLIMQVSSPVVVPAEMGSGIMEILQGLASVGIEKLSMQAKKLMPLEDVTGKTMQQVAWEAIPSLEAHQREGLLQHEAVVGNATGEKRKSKGSLSGSRSAHMSSGLLSGDSGSEYVSVEDLAPLAMDKIEALSIEGLRIQSGMSDEEAPSNISPQAFGDISALQGTRGNTNGSLGMEGAGGLQLLDINDNGDDVDGLMGLSISLDEWMRLDAGIVDEEDHNSERTSKILAAHHANSAELISGGWERGKRKGKGARRCGLLGNNFTVALMVQLRNPLRNYEPVGTPMLALIQVERVFVPPKPKIYSNVYQRRTTEEEEDDKIDLIAKDEKKDEIIEDKKEEESIAQFKITEVHVAGLNPGPAKKKLWGTATQQQSGSRWLLANGMGKTNKHPFMKSKSVVKSSSQSTTTTTVQPGDTLWSISSRVHGTGSKWKELAALNPHIRNPNVIFPNETIRLC